MPEVRTASPSDWPLCDQLWKDTFGDGGFVERLAAERRSCSEILVAVEKGEIVSMCWLIPFTGRIRGESFPVTLLAGAATRPDMRRRGLMGSILDAALSLKHDIALYPDEKAAALYESKGFRRLPCHVWKLDEDKLIPALPDIPSLNAIYEKYYSDTGFVVRDAFAWDTVLDGRPLYTWPGGYAIGGENPEVASLTPLPEGVRLLGTEAKGGMAAGNLPSTLYFPEFY